jgi:dTDP-4-amino-4,6-dideoxygalactose transaminase
MCDMGPIMQIAAEYGLDVIEDAAQAISATYKGRPAGSIGTIGCFSFFPSKNLGGAGDGGMIVTNDQTLFERLVSPRAHGSKPKYHHSLIGGNFRLDPLQAAILLVKLPHLDAWSEARRRNAAIYDAILTDSYVMTPQIHPECESIFNQYTIRVADRDALRAALTEAGVDTEIYYPVPMHLQKCFAGKCRIAGTLSESEEAAKQVLSLPIYPELSEEQMQYVARTITEARALV